MRGQICTTLDDDMKRIGRKTLAMPLRLLRRAFRHRFPGVRFSMRRGKAGWMNATDIKWLLGPSEDEVRRLVNGDGYYREWLGHVRLARAESVAEYESVGAP
jgi:hypothetical protein